MWRACPAAARAAGPRKSAPMARPPSGPGHEEGGGLEPVADAFIEGVRPVAVGTGVKRGRAKAPARRPGLGLTHQRLPDAAAAEGIVDHQRLHNGLATLIERRPLEHVQEADDIAALFRNDHTMPGRRQDPGKAPAEFCLLRRIAQLTDQPLRGGKISRLGVTKLGHAYLRPYVYLRMSSITLPSLGRLPGRANSTLPP